MGNSYSSAITSEGRLFTWGYNGHGQLGDGTTIDRYTPTEITSQFILTGDETIVQVSLDGQTTSALSSEGRVFIWGGNSHGQIGDGTTTDIITPTEAASQFGLNEGETIIEANIGFWHSSVLTSEGRFFIWGYNDSGQLGDGSRTDRYDPIEMTSQFVLNVGETIIQISLSFGNSTVLTSEGRMFIWGANYGGQVGIGTTTSVVSNPMNTPFYMPLLIQTEIHDYKTDVTVYIPTLEGNTFNGWYMDAEMTDLYTFSIAFFSVFLVLFLVIFRLNSKRLDKKLAIFLILIYLIFLVLLFYFSFSLKIG